MTNTDVLLGIAEIAVAFAGFAGLAGVMGRHFAPGDPYVRGARLRGLVEDALIAVAFSILPFVVERLGPSGEALWRVSSLIFGTCWATAGLMVIIRHGRAAEAGTSAIPHLRNPVFQILFFGSTALFLNSAGVFGSRADAVYLAALCATLCVSGILFLRLMSPVGTPTAASPHESPSDGESDTTSSDTPEP